MQRVYSLLCVATEACSLTCIQVVFRQRFPWMPGVSEWVKEREWESSLISADWLCVRTLLQPLGRFVLSLGISPKWKLVVFSGVFWASILHWARVWLSQFPRYRCDFECSNFTRKLSFQLFTLGFRQSVVWLNSNLLFLTAVGSWWVLWCFQVCSRLFQPGEIQVRQISAKPLTLLLSVGPRLVWNRCIQ